MRKDVQPVRDYQTDEEELKRIYEAGKQRRADLNASLKKTK